MKPFVSVVIPIYNGAHFLTRALDSVLAQDMPGVEIIVVDDGSTDDPAAVTSRYSGVKLISQSNQGPAAARNRGIEYASGEFLTFLDADDVWPKGRLAWQLRDFKKYPGTDVIQGTLQPARADTSGITTLEDPHHANSLCTALIRRNTFLHVGLLDESLRFCEDVDWFFTAQAKGLTTRRSEQLALLYLRHDDNATNRMDLVRRYTLQVVARHRLRGGVKGA